MVSRSLQIYEAFVSVCSDTLAQHKVDRFKKCALPTINVGTASVTLKTCRTNLIKICLLKGQCHNM